MNLTYGFPNHIALQAISQKRKPSLGSEQPIEVFILASIFFILFSDNTLESKRANGQADPSISSWKHQLPM